MAPLILHNVPEDELFTGEDGVQRPYAMIYPSADANTGLRARRNVPETGAFGKSRRRSRSKSSGVPTRRDAPSQQAADEVFSNLLTDLAKARAQSPARKQSVPSSAPQANLAQTSSALMVTDGNAGQPQRYVHKEPTEVILRGFGDSQDYAAIDHYETLAGRICEDYSRDPPNEQRRYKSDLRDQAVLRSRPLTVEEKEKARRFAGGNHWIKVTFESAEAAEAALYSSPQVVLGHNVYAEAYNGAPPTILDAVPAARLKSTFADQSIPPASLFTARTDNRGSAGIPKAYATPAMSQLGRQQHPSQTHISPSNSQISSSDTMDTATTTGSSETVKGSPVRAVQDEISGNQEIQQQQSQFCQRIPTAKRATLLPASQALLPQPSFTQRISSHIPLVSWLSKDVIGSQVPRTESGEFDWAIASFYWRLCWLLDFYFKMMNGELVGKEE